MKLIINRQKKNNLTGKKLKNEMKFMHILSCFHREFFFQYKKKYVGIFKYTFLLQYFFFTFFCSIFTKYNKMWLFLCQIEKGECYYLATMIFFQKNI